MNKKVKNFDLTSNTNIEFASIEDMDLMRIKCFATHEGKNENGAIFPREVLLASYKSFIDKRVVIVPDKYGFPVGHGYDFKKHVFDENKRKTIGHITNAYPVIVTDTEQIIDVSELAEANKTKELPNGELRIITDLVIDKFYFSEIAENLKYLHRINDLFFSMESLTAQTALSDGSRKCDEIKFTGLAIVSNPAFANAKSIEIAQKEEKQVDYEKAYKELKEKYDELLKEKAPKEPGKEGDDDKKKKEVAEKLVEQATEIANLSKELASVKEENENLKEYKEKFEVAEKEKLGTERATKMKKLGVEKEAKELAELSDVEFAELIIKESDNFKVAGIEGDGGTIEISEGHYEVHNRKSDVEKLVEGLNSLFEEEE